MLGECSEPAQKRCKPEAATPVVCDFPSLIAIVEYTNKLLKFLPAAFESIGMIASKEAHIMFVDDRSITLLAELVKLIPKAYEYQCLHLAQLPNFGTLLLEVHLYFFLLY